MVLPGHSPIKLDNTGMDFEYYQQNRGTDREYWKEIYIQP